MKEAEPMKVAVMFSGRVNGAVLLCRKNIAGGEERGNAGCGKSV